MTSQNKFGANSKIITVEDAEQLLGSEEYYQLACEEKRESISLVKEQKTGQRIDNVLKIISGFKDIILDPRVLLIILVCLWTTFNRKEVYKKIHSLNIDLCISEFFKDLRSIDLELSSFCCNIVKTSPAAK